MKSSTTITELAKALTQLQGEMPAALMNASNPFFNNARYANLGSIIETSKPLMAKYGFSILQPNTSFVGDTDGVTYVGVNTILLHSSGEWIEDTVFLPINEKQQSDEESDGDQKGDQKKKKKTANHPQKAGIVITYLRRYGWASILGLYAEEDTDGNDSGNASAHVRSEVGQMVASVIASGNKEKINSYRTVLKQYDPSGDANKISDQHLAKVLDELKKLG